MSTQSTTHASFTLERHFPASPEHVYAAFATEEGKHAWFVGPAEWEQTEWELDFREGGTEINTGGPVGGPVSRFVAQYHDIVPNERIVYSYKMTVDGKNLSASVASIELEPGTDGGTHLTMTEQGVYLDNMDNPAQREQGTRDLLDALAASLAG
ncbi:SRPBCC family protein [Pseudarthrobacter sp. P1]|uniref:SRPBCC family protein n=1 Tax=Pseudarthrobacter sp. P1 TaxID=3418418 RepID=UPI003CE6B1C8